MSTKLAKKNNQSQLGITASYRHNEIRAGPIPSPEELQKYENILPGSMDRILKMAENQAEHRQQLEKIVIKSDARNSLIGVVSALCISLSVIVISGLSIYLGNTVLGGVLSLIGLGGIVSAFIYGTKSRREEREMKNR